MKKYAPALAACMIIMLCTGLPVRSAERSAPPFGSDHSFDIMTWNIEWFPKDGQDTIDMVAEVIEDLDLDLIALQEIVSGSAFNTLVDQLPGWGGYRATGEYENVAYLYNTQTVTVDRTYQIFTDDFYAFPRGPYIMEFRWREVPLIAVNLHLKCCDGSEDRRRAASEALGEHLLEWIGLPGKQNIIVLGDFNDEIDEPPAQNVFLNLIEDEDHFYFATMELCGISGQESWPHPPYYSMIDHILVTRDLFDEIDSEGSRVQTQCVDDYYHYYFDIVSDHRPVALALDIRPEEPICTDSDGDEYFAEGGPCGPVDCNDSNPLTYPGASEICDFADNDCDGATDEGPCLLVEALAFLALSTCMADGEPPQPEPEGDDGGGGGSGGCALYRPADRSALATSVLVYLFPLSLIALLKIRLRH